MVLLLLLATVFSSFTHAEPAVSAYRKPGTSYLEYTPKATTVKKESEVHTAMTAAVNWKKLDAKQMVAWSSLDQVKEAFEKVRDSRFIEEDPKFLRRSSWLYPYDGCFARAGLANKNMINWKYPEAYKVFVFGDLKVFTANSPTGQVTWWFHVVPAVRYGSEIYVLDPAIEPQQPVLLKKWLETMTLDLDSVKVSLCKAKTYAPTDLCEAEDSESPEDWGLSDQMSYLPREWDNLLSLNRDPRKELGEFPPWLKSVLP